MKIKKIFKPFIVLVLISALTPVWGQDDGLEATLREMVSQNAESYLAPLATAFGMGANSGTFQRAKPHKILGFDVTLNATFISIPEAATEFEFFVSDNPLPLIVPGPTGDVDISLRLSDVYQADYSVPTFFGSKEQAFIPVQETEARAAIISELATETGLTEAQVETAVGSNITSFVSTIEPLPGPSGIDIPAWASIMPQVSVGLPFNVELMFRGFKVETPDGDPVQFGGFGAKVGFSEFIPLFPIDLAAGWYATNLNLADIVTGNNSILSLQASKSIPFLTLYGGYGVEKTDLSFKYDYENIDGSTSQIKFDLKGKNKNRTTVGVRLKLALLTINVDMNKGEYDAYNLGLGLTLR